MAMRLTMVWERGGRVSPHERRPDTKYSGMGVERRRAYGEEVGAASHADAIQQRHQRKQPRRLIPQLAAGVVPAKGLVEVLRVLPEAAARQGPLLLGEPARLVDAAGQDGEEQDGDGDGEPALDEEQVLPARERHPRPPEDAPGDEARDGAGDEAHHAEDAGAQAQLAAGVEHGAVEDGAGEEGGLDAAHEDAAGQDAAKVAGARRGHGHGAPERHHGRDHDGRVEALGQQRKGHVHERVGDVEEDEQQRELVAHQAQVRLERVRLGVAQVGAVQRVREVGDGWP
jgi:hypothetical protein